MVTPNSSRAHYGFTLIELSIVLVIIGLIIGGVLVGQDLIAAATLRAQTAQIQKYSTAVNTFRSKYGGLPGDLQATLAAQFGFTAGDGSPGHSDGNGVIEDPDCVTAFNYSGACLGDESALFWAQLGQAGLIDGSFSADNAYALSIASAINPPLDSYLPAAKIGNGNYVTASNIWASGTGVTYENSETNYFFLYPIQKIANSGYNLSGGAMTPAQNYAIDSKIDDGLPISGNVKAIGLIVQSAGGYIQMPPFLDWVLNGTLFISMVNPAGGSSPRYSGSACTLTGQNAYNIPGTNYYNSRYSQCSLSFAFQ